ncbi:MAG TPA: hypothetical protein VLM79_34595 [Kofleriaceae bacterium]|nr:hypothetical protein [Kofleriaceae bacterium]
MAIFATSLAAMAMRAMTMFATSLGAIWLGCTTARPSALSTAAEPGLAIAVYAAPGRAPYAVIDDRRWIDVTGDALELERVDPRAQLPSLFVEPLAGGPLEVGRCSRPRIPELVAPEGAPRASESTPVTAWASSLRCAARGAHGRHLVRLYYVVPELAYRASHEVAMTAPGRATVSSRFSIALPAWQRRAELALYDGMPGTQEPPREVARGPVVLDGGIAVLAAPPRAMLAQLRRIYSGAVPRRSDVAPRDPRWQRESHPAVWVWLELSAAVLAPGPVRVHVEVAGETTRDVDVPARGRRSRGTVLDLPLWVDGDLRGRRDRWSQSQDLALIDRFAVSITNLGAAPREVWIEEALRPARRHTVRHARPGAAVVVETLLRMKLTIDGHAVERGGFEIAYEM